MYKPDQMGDKSFRLVTTLSYTFTSSQNGAAKTGRLPVLVSPHNPPLFPSSAMTSPLLCRFHRACVHYIGRVFVMVNGQGVSLTFG